METIPFTDFRKNTSVFINEVEHGETLILVRRGKPVAEIIHFTDRSQKNAFMETTRRSVANSRK
jgi:prevent-host-death family protein